MNSLLPASLLLATSAVSAAAAVADGESHFALKVLPLFREKCLACHGDDEKKIKGKFDMRTAASFARGGESGDKPVIPGKPAESPLFQAVARVDDDSAMPPKENDKLTPEQVEIIKRWISDGAAWPDERRIAELVKAPPAPGKWDAKDGIIVRTSGGLSPDWTNRKYKPEDLWAYQPLSRPVIPSADTETKGSPCPPMPASPRPRDNPIDAFLDARMRSLGIKPAPPADRRTLIRRATYDLTGLPPSPAEIAVFEDDPLPDDRAFAKVIERLLASPRYGEHWGRHWLDVVRYADTSGFANDYERGNAWRYRDYVIRAFNSDKPFDRFIMEQVAGDELAEAPEPGAGNTADAELLIAAGFLRMGPWELTGMEVAKLARQRFLDDVTDAVGQVFLSNALQCCRCHDHKFDPIPTRDYYAMQACFATTQLAEREAPFLKEENTRGFEERRFIEARQKRYQEDLARLDAKSIAAARSWYAQKKLDPSGFEKALADAGRGAGRGGKKARGGYDEARTLMINRGTPEDRLPPRHAGFTTEDYGLERVARKGLERIKWELDRYEPVAFSVYNGRTPDLKAVYAPQRMPQDRMAAGELEETCILAGGDPFAPREKVPPAVLSIIASNIPAAHATLPGAVDGRRTALARWIASPDNPLTTRSIVNRIWLWHFGQPIAGNPNNFGSTGKKPTHPELLDWLAREFIGRGWSFKAMHRLIMTSEAWRRDCNHPDRKMLAEKDPAGTSYAAFLPRRLTAEELRDSMLFASGELNPAAGGIPARPEINLEAALQPRQVMGTFATAWQPAPTPAERHRRSVYVLKIRGLRDPFMEVFNEPTPELSCEARDASNVTPQVFSLFNSEATYDRALALATRVLRETKDDEAAITRAVELVSGRVADRMQRDACLEHWRAMTRKHETLRLAPPDYPREIIREAVEENTGEKFTFREKLDVYEDFIPDAKMAGADPRTRGLAEVCLVLLNSNEFAFVY